MQRPSVANPEKEVEYIRRIKEKNNQSEVRLAHPDSPLEGFAYFESPEYIENHSPYGSPILDKFLGAGFSGFFRLVRIFAKYMRPIMKDRNQSYLDAWVSPEDAPASEMSRIHSSKFDEGSTMLDSGRDSWLQWQKYAWEQWKIHLGFTEVPDTLIFKEKAVEYPYALVCIQEMEEGEIAKAPDLDAGEEVMRVYLSLGRAVNEMAAWIREEFQIPCQAVHPLGGLVNLPPLAAKAGLGWTGHNGLLITPEYGQRQRIAMILLSPIQSYLGVQHLYQSLPFFPRESSL